jgi:flagellar basal-body rod modification protein FlgD
MYTYGATATSGAGDPPATTTQKNTTLDNNDFMLMLMAQLRNQNPLEPMDNKEMMSQFTQLNSLQEIQTIKARMEEVATMNMATYANSLIGKTVTATLKDGQTVEGKVTGTQKSSSGEMTLVVGNHEVPLSAVETVAGA